MTARTIQQCQPIRNPQLFKLRLRQLTVTDINGNPHSFINALSGAISSGLGGGTLTYFVDALHAGRAKHDIVSIRIIIGRILKFLFQFVIFGLCGLNFSQGVSLALFCIRLAAC